ncbi:MAG: DUF4166 domain-containing protein [Pseudomonadota bacterium]
MSALFIAALGPAADGLAPAVRAFHAGPATRFAGEAAILRGRHPLARLAATAFGFPRSGEGVAVTVSVERGEGVERWHRDFGGHRLSTTLCPAGPGRVVERIGPGTFEMALTVGDGALRLDVVGARIAGLALPRLLWPLSEAVEREVDGRFVFDIAVALRGIGPMIRYRGWLEAVA